MTGVCEVSAGMEDEVTVVYTGSVETCKDTVIATDTCGVVMMHLEVTRMASRWQSVL